ncbi:AMP-binding protein [candidate division WOR-3 bacterium]|nr:AMP-binding protein [candidate division WOR-3 bacterium]
MIQERFIETCKKNPSKIAIADLFSKKRLSFQKSLVAVYALSSEFGKLDDSFIGVLLPTSSACALTSVSLLAAGKIPVMINYSTGAQHNTSYAMNKLGFSNTITSKTFLEKIECPEIDGMVFIEDILTKIKTRDKIKYFLKSKFPLSVVLSDFHSSGEEDIAVILFTSGSEKEPKAVQLSHKNILSNVFTCADRLKIQKEDVFMNILPPFHVFGFNVNLIMPLVLGCKSLTYPNPLEYKNISKIIKEEKPTVIAGSPYFLANYSKYSQTGDFSSLRIVISGADKAPSWLFDEYSEKHGITLLEGYGTTETSPVISVNTPDENKRGSIGKPLPNLELEIRGIQSEDKMPVGENGKIFVKGDSVMSGYYDDLEATSFRIRDGWYDTGDIGKLDTDGYLWHIGRLKRFVKIGGEMISLVMIENAIEKILGPGTDCCVVEIPDKKIGSRIVAVLSEEIDISGLKGELSQILPNIAIPREIIRIENMPKMGSGKNDFREITDMVKKMGLNL